MKRVLSLILTLILALTLVACGGEDSSTSSSDADDSSSSSSSEAAEQEKLLFFCSNLGDMGFNDLGHEGAKYIAETGNMDLTVVEAGPDSSIHVTTLFEAIESGGYDWVVTSSWYILDSLMEKFDGDFKDVNFIIYDTNPDLDLSAYDNVVGLSFRQDEGSFLTGVYSAMMTQTNKVAGVGWGDNPIINDFLAGYIQGVKWYNDNYDANVEYVATYYGEATITAVYEGATVFYNNGYDILYNIYGSATLAACNAIVDKGEEGDDLYVIGVDMDQYTFYDTVKEEGTVVDGYEHILTSMLKNARESIIWAYDSISDGSIDWGNHNVGIENGGVGLAMNDNYYAHTPEDVQAEMDNVIDMVKSGEIEIKGYFSYADYDEFNTYRDDPEAR